MIIIIMMIIIIIVIDKSTPDSHRASCIPDAVTVILAGTPLRHEEFEIRRVELRLYADSDCVDARGPHSVIMAYVETDRGSVELKYDEGFLGPSSLDSAARLLSEHLGPSALILRSAIALRKMASEHD